MQDEDLLRYSRQILLPELGIEGQQRLLDSRALLIGLGGLGSPAAMYLAAAGVGTLHLVDDDNVDLSNLQRQVVHTTASIGRPKVDSAAATLAALNPAVEIVAQASRLDDAALDEAVAQASVVLDCSDNFATRFAVNASCQRQRRPLVSGAAIRWEGQVSVFDGRPCYRCLYDEHGNDDQRCSNNGVVSPLVGIIGSVQALEAIKLLADCGETLAGRLLLLDGLRMQWRELRLQPDPACPVCGT
ncbi:MAG: molybdopterin-synthase adenylyltransferase MoeB [Gammaproteobacteria bacterium]|nr:molybdopterin-synthase adenylyltransferase MoeB [Gammaproteobacteria bacterium]